LRYLVIWCALGLALTSGTVGALETDQHWAWGRPLADSTEAVNAKFNLELERAIASFPDHKSPKNCRQIAVAYRNRMRFLLLHDIQIWAWNSELVARIPDGADEQRNYRQTNLYSAHPFVDTGTWMPYTPTIKVAGVRFGTDKLAHLVSSGWTYYGVYRKGLGKGQTPEEAERRAVGRGVIEESLILGRLASGVQSIADIEAGHAGIAFYGDLCDVENPILALDGGVWVIARPVDLRDYVTPQWDESYQPSVYTKGRWKKVRPVLESYCDRLDDPQVVAMRRRYRELDRGSLVGDVVATRVAAGKLPDPAQFGIEAVCGEAIPLDESAVEVEIPPREAGGSTTMEEVIVAEEEDRRRLALGLGGLHLSYPQVVSASVAVMLSSQPKTYDCRTPCDFRGPFIELEPGLGGGKLSVGWARVTGKTNRRGSFLTAAFIGAAYKLTILRTWGEYGWVPQNRTYAGFELGVPVAQANIGLGLLYRVDNGDGRKWTITGSVGWGF
jgi:hypothetical protein